MGTEFFVESLVIFPSKKRYTKEVDLVGDIFCDLAFRITYIVSFQTKNPKLSKFWEPGMEKGAVFYGQFGIVYNHLVS
jgi:hypothetical protein